MSEKDRLGECDRASYEDDLADIERLLPDPEADTASVWPSAARSKPLRIHSQDHDPYVLSRRQYLTVIVAALSVLVLLILNLIALVLPAIYPSGSAPSSSSIATTSAEAKSSLPLTISCSTATSTDAIPISTVGDPCLFDPIILAWLPPQCFNYALLNSTLSSESPLAFPPYEIAGPTALQIYADEELQQPLTSRQVGELRQRTYWVTIAFHRAHCTYAGKLVGEAVAKKAKRGWDEWESDGVTRPERREEGVDEAVYVWMWATSITHVDHCAKVLNNHRGDLHHPEKANAGQGICVRL